MVAMLGLKFIVRERQDDWRRQADIDRRSQAGGSGATPSTAATPDPGRRGWALRFHGLLDRRSAAGPSRP